MKVLVKIYLAIYLFPALLFTAMSGSYIFGLFVGLPPLAVWQLMNKNMKNSWILFSYILANLIILADLLFVAVDQEEGRAFLVVFGLLPILAIGYGIFTFKNGQNSA